MLNSREVKAMLMLRNRNNDLFSPLPMEMICYIKDSATPDECFLKALHHAAHGQLEALESLLEQAKSNKETLRQLLLLSGDVVTPSGLRVKRVTLLECALGAGDFEMATMIKSYFSEFNGGEESKQKQLERYRFCIESMETQLPYDLSRFIEIFINSSDEDAAAILNNDTQYKSELYHALIQFRNDVKPGEVTKPQMHYNYQTLLHALRILNHEWYQLSIEKQRLFWCQVIGYLQRCLPAVDRFALLNGLHMLVNLKDRVTRKIEYRNREHSLPDDSVAPLDFSGLGVDHGIYEGLAWGNVSNNLLNGTWIRQKMYIEQKIEAGKNLYCDIQNRKQISP